MSSVQVSRPLPARDQRDGIETNLRLARILGGEFTCSGYRLETADQGVELRQKVCSHLRSRNVVAVPYPGDDKSIIAPGDSRMPQELDGDGWLVRLVPHDDPITLSGDRSEELDAIEKLAHTTLVSAFQSDRNYWHLSESTRFWYRDNPIATDSGVVLLPRISFATHPLDSGSIGISFGSGHMIRSESSVGEMLSCEGGRRTFERFRERDQGRTGTLIYNTGRTRRLKCYFHGFSERMTVATTGKLKVDQQKFDSLLAYYQSRYPRLSVHPNDPVVYVSFAWGQQPVLVDANLLHLRLLLEDDQVPRKLRRLSQGPLRRRDHAEKCWNRRLESSLRHTGYELADSFWRPEDDQTEQLQPPALLFGNDTRLAAPSSPTHDAYKSYVRQRQSLLRRHGAYKVELSAPKDIWIVVPPQEGEWSQELQDNFVKRLRTEIEAITGQKYRLRIKQARTCREASDQLNAEQPATSLIVFDDNESDRAGYYLLSEELQRWQLKRIKRSTLERAWAAVRHASRGRDADKAERAWNDIIFHSTLDLIDQMGTILWRVDNWGYDACLAIDVSQERRYCAVSFLLCRDPQKYNGCDSFWRYIETWTKTESRRETINPVRLTDKIGRIFEQYPGARLSPLSSVLVLRDGRECDGEAEAIDNALDFWKKRGLLCQSAAVDVAEYHKKTVKELRIWNWNNGEVENTLGGRAVYLGNAALVNMTGAPSVSSKATPDPCLLVGRESADIRRVARAVYALGQHNYLSPNVPYRDAQPMRDADHALQQKVAMEVRGLR